MRTEKSMRRFTAEEQSVALLNLAVPSPILSETEPIFAPPATLQVREGEERESGVIKL